MQAGSPVGFALPLRVHEAAHGEERCSLVRGIPTPLTFVLPAEQQQARFCRVNQALFPGPGKGGRDELGSVTQFPVGGNRQRIY